MTSASSKEKDAIIRMMTYLKFELIRIGLQDEAKLIDDAIKISERKFSQTQE